MAASGPLKICPFVKSTQKLNVKIIQSSVFVLFCFFKAMFLRLLKLNKGLQQLMEHLFKKKWQIVSNYSEFCGVLSCPGPIPCSQAQQ